MIYNLIQKPKSTLMRLANRGHRVETEIHVLKMWFNFDPIPRNSNPGLGPHFSFLHKPITYDSYQNLS